MAACRELLLLHGKAWEEAQTGFFENTARKAAVMDFE